MHINLVVEHVHAYADMVFCCHVVANTVAYPGFKQGKVRKNLSHVPKSVTTPTN